MLFVFDENINEFVCSAFPPSIPKGNLEFAWSHSGFIQAASALCSRYDGLCLKSAFAPLKPASLCGFSAHYAGLAGDFALAAQTKNPIPLQKEIRRWCIKSGLFSCVEPQYKTPWWIHAEFSIAPPASFFVPYPQLFPGNTGPHVFVLQRSLSLLNLPCLLCGRFDGDTLRSLLAFKGRFGLAPEPWVDAQTWQTLFFQIKKAAKPPV